MKAICVVTCALVACATAASAASIEQTFDINVTGAYQGTSTNFHGIEHDRIQTFKITSANVVRALAIDYDTNYYTGTLIYKTSLDGSTTNVVIRRAGKTNELDVTSNFTFLPGPFIVDQVSNTVTSVTTSHVETGFMGLGFNSSSTSFSPIGPSYGTSTRTHSLVVGKINGVFVSGYANLLSYSGGGGFATLNTNAYNKAINEFTTTAPPVVGPVQIQFKTFGQPVVSPN